MFIVVDGIDGAGKTTLVRQLSETLTSLEPVVTKEPTNKSEWGRTLRESATKGRLPRDEEIELFHKDRLWHIENVILPALNNNKPVISDRYVDSTLAFQSDTPEQADALFQSFKSEIIIPDVTFIIKCSVQTGLGRIARDRGHATEFETQQTLEIAKKIFESRQGSNYIYLDGEGTPEDTFHQALSNLCERFEVVRSVQNGSSNCQPSEASLAGANSGYHTDTLTK